MTMRQRLAHIALGGILVLSGTIASSLLQTSDAQQTASNIVKAREFHVVNESGQTTAVIASHSTEDGKGFVVRNSAGIAGMTFVMNPTSGAPFGKLALLHNDIREGVRLEASAFGGMLVVNGRNDKVEVSMLASHSLGGSLSIDNVKGEPAVTIIGGGDGDSYLNSWDILGGSLHGGSLFIRNAKGEVAVSLGQYDEKNGGLVEVRGSNGAAKISVDEHGGRVDVFGKGSDESRAVIGVNEYGNGTVSTWDKNGYRQR